MAVDRGGLQYTIEARDKFSATTQSFRQEMRSSKAAFRDFQNSLKLDRQSTRQLRALADAAKGLATAQRQRATETRRSTRTLTEAERQERKFQQTKQRVLDQRAIEPRLIAENVRRVQGESRVLSSQERTLRAIRQAKARILRQRQVEAALVQAGLRNARAEKRELTAVEEAQRRVARAIRERAVAQQQLNILRGSGREDLINNGLLRRAGELEGTTRRTARNASNIFFSFRRLVGILAVFTLARRGVQTFNELVGLGLRFGDTLETSRVSIAGILLATGELRNEFGETVEGAEALARAEGLAAQQIRQLRQDALATTATFEQLLDTFQIAVGPGIAAGLNLDEIRQLSVSISQAATAIGLPQNQLAEEIRSLLSGTIQARTTRIATVLGISNADIRRLQETGELFEFLEERFASFAASAEKQARETLTGIRALVQGALGEVLGQAAEPLRQELLTVLNDVLDDVLLVRDELGNVAPRPEVVAAFRQLFDALRLGVERARELGENLGFEGLEDLLGALGTGLIASIEFVVGFVEGLAVAFGAVKDVVDAIAETFGLTNRDLGRIAGVIGTIVAAMFVWNNTAGLVGLKVSTILSGLVNISRVLVGGIIRNFGTLVTLSGRLGRNLLLIARSPLVLAAAGIAAILKGTELWFESVLDVELGFKDVTALIGIGVIEALDDAITLARLLIAELQGAIEAPGEAVEGVANQLGDIGLAFLAGLGSETADLALEQSLTEQAGVVDGLLAAETERERKVRETKEQLLQELEARREIRRLAVEGIQTEAGDRERAEGSGFEGFDPDETADGFETANDAAGDFFGTLSNANQTIRELAEGLLELQDELDSTAVEFAALEGRAGIGGVGGNIARLFTQADIDNADRLRKITNEQRLVQEQINRLLDEGAVTTERLASIQEARRIQDPEQREEALAALELTQAESTLVSLFRDKLDLSEAIRESQGLQTELAARRAAIIAREELPALQQQNQVLNATAAAQERVAQATAGVVAERQRDLIAAQNSLAIAREEEAIAAANRDAEIGAVSNAAAQATGAEQQQLLALVTTLEQRAELEERIAQARLMQLELAQQEADLIANGSFGDGIREGFNDILEELPTAFETGVAIIRGSVAQLSSFISQSIVSAFDPTDDTSLQERFARFLQSLATLILNQIVQLLVATAIAKAFGVPLPGDSTPPPAIPGAGAEGGEVPSGFASGGRVGPGRKKLRTARQFPNVRGFRGGGGIGPRDPRDTVPAFLQPGEFVMRKSIVDSMGVGFFEAVNNGNFSPEAAPTAAPSGAKAASAGMQTGGLVADRVAASAAVQQASEDGEQGGFVVAPAVVAREREMDTLANGGSKGLLNYIRENAGEINGLLDRSSRRG